MHTVHVTTVSVLVPTWRRPEALARCLRALAAQTVPPIEVVVALRPDDGASWAALSDMEPSLGLKLVRVPCPEAGVIAAMNAALSQSRGEIVALTDDDAAPWRDWLQRIVEAFADPRVGGVGGRDWQPLERGDRADVGRVQWFGRVVGNHHLGAGPRRPVDVLKGANAAFRAPLLRATGFDARLEGSGAQMFWELALCLPLRRAGWTLLYDPAIAVNHHIEPRHDEDQRHRGMFAVTPQTQAVHNETLVLLEHLRGLSRLAFIAWALLVGTRSEPGLMQLPRLVLMGDAHASARWRGTLGGRVKGWRHWRHAAMDASSRLPHPPA